MRLVRDWSLRAVTIVSKSIVKLMISADRCDTDCPECSDDTDFDMCQDCYRQGKTCHSPDNHRLYVYLRANVDRPHPDFATDGISCTGCEVKIKQGPFYCG